MAAVRTIIAGLSIAGLVGCASLGGSRESRPTAGPVTSQTPAPQNLVAYVNANAARVEAIEATDVALEVKAGSQGGGLSGTLYCEKPKNFRLRAKAVGKPVADFGSNNQEFWYWISQDNPPYLYHCNYTDLARGDVALPFPFQPDWVLECLGMATLNNSPDNFRVERKGDKFELHEKAISATGRPVTKVTVFRGGTAYGTEPQIKEHRLIDERGQTVAVAEVHSVKRDTGVGAVVPSHLVLKWPQQKLEMELRLTGIRAYPQAAISARNPDLFRRESLRDLPTYDLARRAAGNGGVERTGGLAP